MIENKQQCFVVLAKRFGDKTRERKILIDTHISDKLVAFFESHIDYPIAIGFYDEYNAGYYYQTERYIQEWKHD